MVTMKWDSVGVHLEIYRDDALVGMIYRRVRIQVNGVRVESPGWFVDLGGQIETYDTLEVAKAQAMHTLSQRTP